ncbi:MAG: NAD-dependent epimerase [Elusimicrobiota bacterium]|nr:NAD-dependent epimerase [Elusimicrobiota bacterium]
MKILVTGAAGFIGFHLSRQLVLDGKEVIGVDNLNPYYDVNLKLARLKQIEEYKNFKFVKLDLKETDTVIQLFEKEKFDFVLHMAAQAGVRYSLKNPYVYVESNVYATLNILEAIRKYPVKHFVLASTSSVYGANKKIPFSVHHNVDHPISLYAATKKSAELIAHTYSALFNIPTTVLRFFTVYGPWGRPDMALFIFTKNILEDKPIDVYNYGKMKRDFTYIDDVVESVIRIMEKIPQQNKDWDAYNPDPSTSFAPYKVYNIGNNRPVELSRFIEVLEECLGKKAKKNLLPIQPGDVPETFADIDDLIKDIGFRPSTPIEVGIKNFVDWYIEYYKIKR